jgi:hypothetical protein
MRALIIILFLAFTIQARAGDSETYSLASKAQGKVFTFKFTREQLLKTPVWKLQDDFPPLSPRKAEKAATAKFQKLIKNAKDWNCDGIALENPFMDEGNRWIYLVVFSPPIALNFVESDSIQIIVLMDGTVVEPIVTDAK